MENREVDTLIAEKIFGWKTTNYGLLNVIDAHTEDDDITLGKDFSPSEDIYDAWVVVNKMSYGKTERAFKLENSNMGFWASFAVNDTWHHSGRQRNAPLAICLAALKAVGVEVTT